MEREKLKMVAGYYFKDQMGAEPRALTFTYEDHDVKEYTIEARFGRQLFEIHMLPLHNRISLTEKCHLGFFADAAQLTGMDARLNDL